MISVPAFLPCANLILQNAFVGLKCAIVTLGAPPNPRISKMILDYLSGGLLVQVISNVLMSIMIVCIAMGVFGTILNGLMFWVMFPLLGALLSARYVVLHLYELLCVMLE